MIHEHIEASEIERYLALLEDTIRRIRRCTSGHDETRLRLLPGEGGWSAVDILAHLRACDEVWSHGIYTMLTLENPNIPKIHPRQWARTVRHDLLLFEKSFSAFALGREELLRVLRVLPHESWRKSGLIDGRMHTVFSQVRRMALHEAGHCVQMESLFL